MSKQKYDTWLGDKKYRASKVNVPKSPFDEWNPPREMNTDPIPEQLILEKEKDSGFFLGVTGGRNSTKYVGIQQGVEGNICVIGGNGSGKSAGIVKQTLRTWSEAMCVTDIKGELSATYEKLYRHKLVKRPYIIFNPLKANSMGYDPFYILEQDSEADLINHIWAISIAIIPLSPEDNQPFWVETEQGIFAAALLYYFRLGLSFSETIIMIASSTLTILVQEIQTNGNEAEKIFLGEIKSMKPETLADLDRGLRNKIMNFATDPYINWAFRGKREGANCFTWNDLDEYNIFLCVPEDRIEQWSKAINLMYTQLIQHLERRPDKHSISGFNNVQTLLILDEFARFGKLEIMTNAISTLRSKCVNICLIIQSIAQLDKIYDVPDRRIIMDNCQFQAILRANDAETQKYCSELIGKHKHLMKSYGKSWSDDTDGYTYNTNTCESFEYKIQPHELSTLKDILLLSPDGFCRVKKDLLQDNDLNYILESDTKIIYPIAVYVLTEQKDLFQSDNMLTNIEATAVQVEEMENDKEELIKMPTLEERVKRTHEHTEELKKQQRIEKRANQQQQKKKDQRRNYIIGELVTKYFPELKQLEPGNATENSQRFKPLESILLALSMDKRLVEHLKETACDVSFQS